MATYHHSFQLGILPERKIDRRALAASYAFIVLITFVIINLGILFPDSMPFRTYRVTSLIPVPALKPEPAPIKVKFVKAKLLPRAPVFDRPKLIVPRVVHRVPAPERVEAPRVVVNTFAAPQLRVTSGGARPQLLHV
jgi:hypothetical protein